MIGRAAIGLVVIGALGVAHAERPLHGSVGGGSSLLLTGARGDHWRFELALDVKPWSRHGIGLAWRGFDRDHRGLVMVGWNYEGAAARPRLVLDLHADAGADLDAKAPVVGGGVRATVAIVGPLGVVLDAGAYLVIDGFDDSRLQLQSSTLLVLRW